MADNNLLHKKEYGCLPEVEFHCPGKITLSGEHTEYYDGVIISSTIDLYCRVSISKRSDNAIKFYSNTFKERKKCSISNIKLKREDRWSNYVKGVISSIIQNGHALSGMDITIDSDIPIGIGLGSSAALCLATACCIKKLYNLDMSWLNLIESARYSESVFMGLYTGLNEAMTMLFGKKDSLFYLDTSTLEYKNIPFNKENIHILVLNPGVINSESHIDFISDREELYGLASKLSKGKNQHSLRNYRINDIRSCLDVPERLKRKAIYIVEEIKRSLEAKSILESGNFELFGRYLVRSHEGLRDLFEVTCPEVDWLIKRGVETEGIHGGKASGEILSGIVVFIMDTNGDHNLSEHLEEYDKIFGFKAKLIYPKLCDGIADNYQDII